ncbi:MULTISPECIES: hypothetical protein [unclassified Nocardia]|uniref:hypothetical protein n=1 Tax=unclassified Nocardia TaxID=2637762 RepID=UPI0024A7E21B|nr:MULTISPECIES: hypothetical protein [unclassified Nocardia]
MNSRANAVPVRTPRLRDVASRAQLSMFRAVWVGGGLAVVAALVLLIGAFTANSAAGASGEMAGVLGLIALSFGAAVLVVGALVRSAVITAGSRAVHDH